MADPISKLIDQPVINDDIVLVINKLGELETKIKEFGDKIIEIKVDFKGAETLNGLSELMQRQKEITEQLNGVVKENKAVSQQAQQAHVQWGESIKTISATMVQQKDALDDTNRSLGVLKSQLKEGAIGAETYNKAARILTQRQQELKVAIGETTTAIKTNIKETKAAKGSMDEMSQTLFQMKEKYRSLSKAERENANV